MASVRLILGLVLSTMLGLAGYRRGVLAPSGVLGAVIVGTLTVGFGGWAWGLLLVAFFTSSSLLSLYRSHAPLKSELSDKFAKGHRRDLSQTLANGGLATLLALMHSLSPNAALLAAFVGALATVTADTWATEIGVLSRQVPRMVTTWRRVPPGASGGITLRGSLAALAGALFIGLCAVLFIAGERLFLASAGAGVVGPTAAVVLWPLLPIAGVSGLAGAFFDSLLGASLQRIYYCDLCRTETEQPVHRCGNPTRPLRGWAWLDNDMVNFLSSCAGAALAAALAGWLA